MSARVQALLIALPAFAQTQATPHVSISYSDPSAHVRENAKLLDQIAADLDTSRLHPADMASWEGQIVHGAEKAAANLLTVALGDENRQGMYTIPRPDGDVLVARWKNAGPDRLDTAVWLWDSPTETIFLAEIGRDVLQPAALAQFYEGLFQWNTSSRTAARLGFTPLNDRDTIALGTIVESTPRQFAVRMISLIAGKIRNHAIASVWLQKDELGPDYPREAIRVPERFPPLRERARHVSRAQIFAELEKNLPSTSIMEYPRTRIEILDHELILRGRMSDEEVLSITLRDFTNRGPGKKFDFDGLFAGYRLNAFFRAAAEHNALPSYLSALTEILTLAPTNAPDENNDHVAGLTLTAMREAGMNTIDLSIALIEQRRFVRKVLFHLSRLTPTQELIDRLSKADVPDDFVKEQQRVLGNLKRKLATSAKHH